MSTKAYTTIVAALAVLLLAGWMASNRITATDLKIVTRGGETRVHMGTDSMGNGFLVVRDWQGTETFSVRGKKIFGQLNSSEPAMPQGLPPAQDGETVVQLIRIEPIMADPTLHGQIEALIAEADGLDEEAREAEADAAELRDEKSKENKTQIQRFKQHAAELKQQAKRKRGDARRLERELREVRQRVFAWNGQAEVILETDRDLSRQLNEIPRRGYFTWRGHRTEINSFGLEVYTISSLQHAERPAAFNDAP